MKKFIGVLFAVLFSFWLVRPLFSGGYFPMHDDTQVARVVVMGKALREGQFPVRWVSDLGYGYGYPIYNFYGPLPYYVGGGLSALGVNSVAATKLMFGIGIVLASITFYLLLEEVFGSVAALTGTVLFSYAPYHAVDIYVRGAVGEYWAIAFLPLLVLGFVRVCEKKSRQGIVIGAVGLAGVILSHTILGYLTTGMVILSVFCYGIVSGIRKTWDGTTVLKLVELIALGLGLSVFFWLPAFGEMSTTGVSSMITGAATGFFDHFVCPIQLWNSPWGFGGSAQGCVDGMSFKLGKPEILMASVGIGILLYFLFKKKQSKAVTVMGGSVILLVVSLVGVLAISQPLWSIVPFYSFVQYPWRLLSYTIVWLGITGAFCLTAIHKKIFRIILAICVIALCIGVNAKLFQPHYLYTRDSRAFETPTELRFRISKISDEYMPAGFKKPLVPADVANAFVKGENITVRVVKNTDTDLKVAVTSARSQSVQIQKAYFPGWNYQINGRTVIPKIALGLPSVIVSEGTSIIECRLTNTPIRLVGNIISILSVVLTGAILFYGKKTNT